jgi:putative FmdB family regulatory protein
MPIYDYQCGSCQHQLEVIQKITADPLTQCPACQQSTLVKQMSATRFRLGGSGWYESDEKPKDKQRYRTEASVAAEKTATAPAEKTATSTVEKSTAAATEKSTTASH